MGATTSTTCAFCSAAEMDARTVHATDELLVIRDIRPAAAHHWLVVPRAHVADVHALRSLRAPGDGNGGTRLLRSMLDAGRLVAERDGSPSAPLVMGFHVPPFVSVPHLHLHVLQPPYRSCLVGLKYTAFWLAHGEALLDEMSAADAEMRDAAV